VSPPLRVALVGAGRMGRVHLRALQEASGVEPAGVVEPAMDARAAVEAEGVAAYATLEQLLDQRPPEAAVVAAPSHLHVPLVQALAAAGVPVLCEKPAALHADDARLALAAAAAAGVPLQVGYWRRFVPALQELQVRAAAGELGDLQQISCWQWDAEPPPDPFRAASGGIAIDMGVHELDQLRWLTGQEIAQLRILPGALESGPAVDGDPECAAMLVGLSGGTLGVVSAGRRFADGDCCWVEVVGTRAYARCPFMWGAAGQDVFRSAVRRQLEAFAGWVRGGEPQGATGEDALAALEAAELAAASLGAGRGVPA
jgi:myo-inositol 2-dehydrogenase/D-chiro-inositol 1-dehydrogenase